MVWFGHPGGDCRDACPLTVMTLPLRVPMVAPSLHDTFVSVALYRYSSSTPPRMIEGTVVVCW